MAHAVVPEAEAMLKKNKKIKVLNHGFIRLVDYLGSDDRIVEAARVSYGKGTKSTRENKQLIDYLLRNQHTSPFEQVVFTFHLKMPIFVARQWVRHRTARMNEISGRYSVMSEEFYVPARGNVHYQSESNRQGRDEKRKVPPELVEKFIAKFEQINREAYAHYKGMIDDDLTRELARIALPLSLYTEFYWQMDLHNLLHFIELRMESHAQLEIRLYAQKIADIVKTVVPFAWEAFENHVLNSRKLSAEELEVVRDLIEGRNSEADERTMRTLREKLSIKAQDIKK